MIVLLAESKTMSSQEEEISQQTYKAHEPTLEAMADKTMAYISSLSSEEISERLGVSGNMARSISKMAYEFPFKSLGYTAIKGFTGVAFKAFRAEDLSQGNLEYAQNHLRIISSLYGILRPCDIIKPYRLEFNKNCGPANENITKYLKAKTTISLVKFLKETAVKEVLDLLPSDAAKLIDWKIIKAFAKVERVSFQFIDSNEKLKTPGAAKLKELRGKMAREIIEKEIKEYKDLIKTESIDYLHSKEYSKPGYPVFLVSP